MKAEGTVKSVNGELCLVVTARETACGENCASCGGSCRKNYQICEAINSVGALPGDRVIIEMDSKKVLMSAFFVYIFPLIVFITVFCTVMQNRSQMLSAVAAAIAAAGIYAVIYLVDKRRKREYISKVTEII